ncbi:homeobox protein cut isoform X2 [Rhopalosiphum maidis]|uniref:homeobox protein cut isoform X2 n=1 Tax=Rhopalosiphum maidis TaxID=43146 RepID=UPI000EFE37F4|nr:homeobox protein cut isoform X2 [Rhopalosiphum maidis]
MDVQAMQSMDWLFKKERIYLLAQFWQQRATLAEKEVTTLKEQLTNNKSQDTNVMTMATPLSNHVESTEDQNKTPAELELSAKEKEISQLVEDVRRLQSSIGKLQDHTAKEIARLEEELHDKRQHIMRLEARLDAQRDYEEVKRQLCVLKAVECSDDRNNKSPNNNKSENTQGTSPQQQRSSCSPVPEIQNDFSVPVAPPPPGLQNVEQFGPILGEEIVANWRRSLECNKYEQKKVYTSPNRHETTDKEKSPGLESIKTPPPSTSPAPTSPSIMVQPTRSASRSGTPCKSPTSESNSSPRLNNSSPHNNNNNPSQLNNNNNNNNNIPAGLINGLCGLNVGLNNNILGPAGALGFDLIKSPFDHRSPYRFGDGDCTMVGRFGESLIPKGDPMEARLQEMLRYNMDKYSTQNLDTLHIARRVRELLSIHNVGQRLFAKYILGLSQGTVSELLSKPKPWDKLTEKGRDSYRKMHAWACDENAVMLLKSLIPKKDSGIPTVLGRTENDVTDERIVHILNEASQMMKPNQQQDDTQSNDESTSPNQLIRSTSPSRQRPKEDIPQEQVARLYQEELSKIMGKRLEDSMRSGEQPFAGWLFPHFFGNHTGNHDDIRTALDAYHRELSKLQNCPQSQLSGLLALQQQAAVAAMSNNNNNNNNNTIQGTGMAQDLSLPKDRKDIYPFVQRKDFAVKVNGTEVSDKESETVAEAMKQAGSAFSLVRPKTEQSGTSSVGSSASSPLGNNILPPEDFGQSAAVSPLQRMASITNALISQPATPHHHSPSQRPLKAVLPPITQQQFDQFNNLNTEEIVRKVKEQLSQFSISQRLFGESVLGLSQGSVSDLLARPKPWHMLTQKGREPFIRMKMFLEDDKAVHKLVASQYKIAPEKLMRTGGYGGSSPMNQNLVKSTHTFGGKMTPSPLDLLKVSGDVDRQTPHHHILTSMCNTSTTMSEDSDMASSLQSPSNHHIQLQSPGGHHQATSSTASSLISTGSQLASMIVTENKLKASPIPNNGIPQNLMLQHVAAAFQNTGTRHPPAVVPSVYEMAALTQDLDTQTITTKIKEALLANNIGQKIFGEAVLGLSQGSVSELLSKPKPWHMLSIKGREPFIRMQLWLSDQHNVERLQAIKSERRELNKRRRGSGQQDNGSDTSSNDTSDFYHSGTSSPPSAAKKQRVLFSDEQKEALKLAFALDQYPSVGTIEFLASELNLATRTITNWFHNHRMRIKQQSPHSDSQQQQSQTGPGFDPIQFKILLSHRLGFGGLPIPFNAGNPYLQHNADLSSFMPMFTSSSSATVDEQMSGLDLSVKHEVDTDFDDEDSRSEESEPREEIPAVPVVGSSRRKPAAPQWVNPDWLQSEQKQQQQQSEVIINGVCVMQAADGCAERRRSETIRVEPSDVNDEDKSGRSTPSEASSLKQESDGEHEQEAISVKEEKSWNNEF